MAPLSSLHSLLLQKMQNVKSMRWMVFLCSWQEICFLPTNDCPQNLQLMVSGILLQLHTAIWKKCQQTTSWSATATKFLLKKSNGHTNDYKFCLIKFTNFIHMQLLYTISIKNLGKCYLDNSSAVDCSAYGNWILS